MTVLRDWLRRSPVPETIQVGEKKVKVPEGKRRWIDLIGTIESLGKPGDKLLCLDKDSNVIRATTLQGEGEVDATAPAEEESTSGRTTKREKALVLMSRLLKEAGDAAADRYRDMFQIAFDAQNSMITTMLARMTSVENAYMANAGELAKANAAILKLIVERDAAGNQDGEAALLSQVATAMLSGQAAAKGNPPKALNGKKKAED